VQVFRPLASDAPIPKLAKKEAKEMYIRPIAKSARHILIVPPWLSQHYRVT